MNDLQPYEPVQLIEAGGKLYARCANGTIWMLKHEMRYGSAPTVPVWQQMPLIGVNEKLCVKCSGRLTCDGWSDRCQKWVWHCKQCNTDELHPDGNEEEPAVHPMFCIKCNHRLAYKTSSVENYNIWRCNNCAIDWRYPDGDTGSPVHHVPGVQI